MCDWLLALLPLLMPDEPCEVVFEPDELCDPIWSLEVCELLLGEEELLG